ncbi:hypothetical protein [Chryseobacterium salviniae]|uniref:Uncharacterized protein n=1 Tax=Chryseobacterium salviniae TaxID=3101750 RepID=A0ABU6HSA8_9FLAO|nr:hypothetical protein [Chryseobacterium sp. T9W2-O]MEC3875925.1 hypothetical protein [Chryseobacterium sp. T9W2-O]
MQTDGVPLTADLMDQLQNAYAIFNVIGDVAGHLTILSGCEINGTLVNPGIVVINGDVLFFEGGTIYQTVFIHQEDIYKTFKNQVSKILIEKKTVKFGDSTTVYNWADFVRIDTLKQIKEALALKANQSDLDAALADIAILKMKTAPIVNGGVILPFRKPASEIPAGWKECTDTTGKMLIHCDPNDVDFSTLGATVGNKTVTLVKNNLPNLNTSFGVIQPYDGTPSGGGFDGGGNQWRNKTITINPGGNSEPVNVVNPAKIVNFIEPNFQ